MYTPLVCTANSLGSIDYGVPLVANKSTDYRTATVIGHKILPSLPHDFDIRAKAPIKHDLLQKDLTIKEATTKSEYKASYPRKETPEDACFNSSMADGCLRVNYTRNVQEKIFQNPPRPALHDLSEMKAMYQQKGATCGEKIIDPPAVYSRCDLKSLGRDEQPGVPPEATGYWKWLDPYLSTNRSSYVPFTKIQQDGVARKDIVTYYDVSGFPKSKGFGPKDPQPTEPVQGVRKELVYDRIVFKSPITGRLVYRPAKRIPHNGMKSQYQSSYLNPCCSNKYPYLFEHGVWFEDSLSGASPWQYLAPPAAYCTEMCHIGTGWSVSAVVDTEVAKTPFVHKPCCVKVQTR